MRIQAIAIIISFFFLYTVARLIIKGRLREEYAIIWITAVVSLLIFSLWRKGLDFFSNLLGIYEPMNMVFATVILIILFYLLHLSLVASKLHQQNKKLAQEVAILKHELRKFIEKEK